MIQKAIIVRDDSIVLNVLLEEGYRVVNTCPMPSSISAAGCNMNNKPTCLVIVQKD